MSSKSMKQTAAASTGKADGGSALYAPMETEPAVKSAGFSCYIGPNLYGIIQTATIYPAGREEALELPEVKLALSRMPEIAGLIVDGSTLAEDRIKVKQPGTPLYEAYRALKKKTGG